MLAIFYFLLSCWLATAMLGALLLGAAALAAAGAALAVLALKSGRKAKQSLGRLAKRPPLNRCAGDKRPKS